ncbi:DUF397 domain-containing protein [Streptomyces sp. H27-D2]|uniref:DUF397 domain-containing protein n=1 Tax=Streptomyces sp. H27-D2 TaxID=3046304 RepID=UPI002DB5591C|nr:DUF397 domain-containing protein [Streptomyces sp. H27-D2]MEC4017764.1 DUF397 domain-containing protein [Streptomyces sp. H27-D2]
MTTEHITPQASTLTGWRKSTYSGGDQDSCVEVADGYADVPVRDSKDPHGPALIFPADAWSAFVQDVKFGRFAT